MKKIETLVLNQIAKKELSQRQMWRVKAGKACTCGCCYAGSGGGSDSVTNGFANCDGNKKTYCEEIMGHGGYYGC